MLATIRIDIDIHRFCHTDGIADLHQHLITNACSHHVLGNVAGSIGSRTVNLRRVLARESTTTVSSLSAIGIDDNLTARQTSISMGAANHELTCWIDKVFDVVAKETEHRLGVNLLLHTRNQDIDDILANLVEHTLVVRVKLVVLRRYHDGVDALRNTIVTVLYGHLALGIGTQIGHLTTFPTDVSQRTHDEMCQVKAYRHQVLRLVRSVAEHHTLVASTLILILFAVNATVDVLTLLVNGSQDTTGIAIKLILRLRIAYLLDGVASYGLQVNIHLAAHLTHNDHLTCSYK